MTVSRLLWWLLTGSNRASISATAWDRRADPRWHRAARLIDWFAGAGHCEEASRYHAGRRAREYRLDKGL